MLSEPKELAFSPATEQTARAELSEEIMRARIEEFLQKWSASISRLCCHSATVTRSASCDGIGNEGWLWQCFGAT